MLSNATLNSTTNNQRNENQYSKAKLIQDLLV